MAAGSKYVRNAVEVISMKAEEGGDSAIVDALMKIAADDTEFEIRFDYVMYQNIGDEAGVIYDAPSVILDLTIGSSAPALLGDINGDGTVNAADVSELIYLISRNETPDTAVADINGDGTVNATDVSELIQRITGDQ